MAAGRPPVDSEPLTLRLSRELLDSLDKFRESEADRPSRTEALRRVATSFLQVRNQMIPPSSDAPTPVPLAMVAADIDTAIKSDLPQYLIKRLKVFCESKPYLATRQDALVLLLEDALDRLEEYPPHDRIFLDTYQLEDIKRFAQHRPLDEQVHEMLDYAIKGYLARMEFEKEMRDD